MSNTIIKPVEKEEIKAAVAPLNVPDKAVDEVDLVAPVKRTRGRPALNPDKPAFETVDEDSAKPAAAAKRGRKPNSRTTKKSDPKELGKQIVGVHLMISMMTGLKEIQLSDVEGEQLAGAVIGVAEQYNLAIDGKTGAAIQLLAACAMVYAPRALMIRHRMRQESMQAAPAELDNFNQPMGV